MRARWWHQGGNAGYQLQRREVQLVDLGAALVRIRLTALLGTAVHQLSTLFAQTIHGKGRTSAVARQALLF